MEYFLILLEWIGTLFLAVEAIKINNLKKFRDKVILIRKSLNPKYIYFGNGEHTFEPGILKWNHYRKFALLYDILLGLLFLLLLSYKLHLLHLLTDNYNNIYLFLTTGQWWLIILKFIGAIWILFVPAYIGIYLTIFICWCLDRATNLLSFIEANTANGIIGIIGFLILSSAFLIKFLIL